MPSSTALRISGAELVGVEISVRTDADGGEPVAISFSAGSVGAERR